MTHAEALILLRELRESTNTENTDNGTIHEDADTVLIEFLRANGFADLADAWELIEPKWYA